MERQFNNGDFEKLLRDNANQYRMYPSEKVWNGIHSTLHTRRRWYGLTALIMFLVTGSVVSYFIFNDKPEQNNLAQQKNTVGQKAGVTQNPSPASTSKVPFTPAVNKPAPVAKSSITDINVSYLNITDPISTTDHGVAIYPNERLNDVLVSESVSTDITPKTEFTNGITEQQSLFQISSVENKKVSIEATGVKDAVVGKNIAEQSKIADTEKKMSDLISALASQNATLSKPKKQSKVTAQVYFTPTVSYRKLSENKKVYSGSGYVYVPVIDLNNVVKHKPAMGLEFGIEGRYHLSDRLSLKSGFQFNINRYDIKAYAHPTEIATVALSSGFGVDSLATLSNYRNFGSNDPAPNWLENFYFQASIPIGIELILSDKNDFQWGISGSIQPTYVIGDKAYVISSDYKNYAKFPDLMRRWNISTGFGTFVSYSTGRIKWQAGPHVRYQHLSSFANELTVKEKLFSVGLKVGATLNKKK
jgi:hypothetical protein